jgi:hypothetical protein
MKKITDLIVKLIVLFALSGIIFILTLINTKLLMFMNWYKIGYGLDNYFALVSGTAYALGSISVIIWYNKGKLSNVLLKTAFVILDGIHVYVYQNLSISEQMIPEIASVVFAIQTILILYFIGSVINDMIMKSSGESNFDKNNSQFLDFESKIGDLNTKIQNMNSNYSDMKSNYSEMKSNLEEKESIIGKMKSEINKKDSHIKELQTYFFRFQKARILKTKPENRTEEDNRLLLEAENQIQA